jgi:histidinol-phosphate aminotransferase
MNIAALARPEIVAMKPYSSARSEAPAQGVLLNANEAPRSLLGDDVGAADWEARLNRYPDPQPQVLVERLAALYGVRAEQVLVTRGSDEGIDLLTRVFCRAGTDAILHCPPTFGMYRIAAQAQGAAIVEVPRVGADGFRLDGERLLTALQADRRVKLVFLTSPNNPTGDAIDPDLLQRLLAATRNRAVVVLDEAYAEFCSAPSAAALVDRHPHLVVLRTLSKAWGAAGLRCGVVLAQPELIGLLRRVIAPYPLPSPVVALALRMLQDDMLERQRALLQEIGRNKRALIRTLTDRPFVQQLIPGQANFVLVRVTAADNLLAFCAGRGVVLRGFPADPLLRGYLRISVGSTDDIAALTAVLDAWQEGAAQRVEETA